VAIDEAAVDKHAAAAFFSYSGATSRRPKSHHHAPLYIF
jgi:hypothetical protein